MTGILDRIAAVATSDGLPLRPRVLLALLCFANDHGEAWPSVPTLAQALGAGERKVREALKALEADGLIECESRGKGGRNGGTTHWLIAPQATAGGIAGLRNPAENGQGLGPENPAENGQGYSAENPAEIGQGIGPKPCPNRAETLPESGPKPCPNRAANYTIEQTKKTMEAPERPMDGSRDGPRLGDLLDVLERFGLRVDSRARFRFGSRVTLAGREGLTTNDLTALVRKAKAEGENPLGLLWHWLEVPTRWRDVLLDAKAVTRPRVARSREGRGGLSTAADLISQVMP